MRKIASIFVTFTVFISLGGCDAGESTRTSDALEKISEELSQVLDQSKRAIRELEPKAQEIGTQAGDEVEKLFVFEYRVEEVPSTISAQDLSRHLNKLGAERWECFWIQELTTELRITCRRRPKSYLRYIPRWVPGL